MSLAASLREALDLGHSRSPLLLEGDPLDPMIPDDRPVTPAAVLVPIVDRSEPTVILTLRPETMRKHAGQISFRAVASMRATKARWMPPFREAEEEIALPRSAVEIVGIADRYRTITGFEVTPVLGVIPPDLPLAAHEQEVAAIFEAPLHYLLKPEHHVVRTAMWRGRERCYYEIDWQGRRIWGATAAMIVNLSRRLELVA